MNALPGPKSAAFFTPPLSYVLLQRVQHQFYLPLGTSRPQSISTFENEAQVSRVKNGLRVTPARPKEKARSPMARQLGSSKKFH